MPYHLVASINPNSISMRYNKDFPFRTFFENFSQRSLLCKQTIAYYHNSHVCFECSGNHIDFIG